MSEPPPEQTPSEPMSGRQAYNLVADTVTGPNVRLRDNLYQALAIFIGLVLGAVVGAFVGLLAGLFGSGLFLMIYRAVQHARGRHD